MSYDTFIGLDIETTGLDGYRDQIIEIALIKFGPAQIYEGKAPVETFQSLVNPGISIPQQVTYITGITDEEVKNAPSFESIKGGIADFVGDSPIFGHHISFDVNFLRAKGLALETNPLLDTLELAPIAFPENRSYSLEALSETLGLDHLNKHRAYDDTLVTFHLFLKIKEKLEKIRPEILQKINQQLKKSSWQWKFLFEKIGEKQAQEHADKHQLISKQAQLPLEEKKLPQATADKNFQNISSAPNHALKNLLKNFCEKNGRYLVECEEYKNSELATAIIELKTPSIIALKKIDELFESNQIVVLHAPENYFSIERFEDFLQKPAFSVHESTFLVKCLLWLDRAFTKNSTEEGLSSARDGLPAGRQALPVRQAGLRYELPLMREEKKLWQEVNEDLLFPSDPEKSFFSKALKECEKKQLIITSHQLLAQQLKEAHSVHLNLRTRAIVISDLEVLEKNAAQALTQRFDLGNFEHLVQKLKQQESEKIELMESIHARIEIIFGLFGIILNKHRDLHAFNPDEVMIFEYMKSDPDWKKILASLENLKNFLKENSRESFAWQKLAQSICGLHEICSMQQTQDLRLILTLGGDIIVISTPHNISELLAKKLWNHSQELLLISKAIKSATSGNKQFQYIKDQLNLDDFEFSEHYLSAEREEKILLECPDIPDNKSAQSSSFEKKYLLELISETDRRLLSDKAPQENPVMIVTNSVSSVKNLFAHLAADLKKHKLTLLGQNISGGFNKIVELYLSSPQGKIILGNYEFCSNFLENLENIGKNRPILNETRLANETAGSISENMATPNESPLIDKNRPHFNQLIIHRLLFDHPDNFEAKQKSARYQNPFLEFSLPRTILNLKKIISQFHAQGGQHIIALDSKLTQKDFGKTIIANLPSYIQQ